MEVLRELFMISSNDPREIRGATASPGLMTLIDTALYRSNEGVLFSTVHSSQALLACLIEFKNTCLEFLNEVLLADFYFSPLVPLLLPSQTQRDSNGKGGGILANSSLNNINNNNNMSNIVLREQAESFARLCLDCIHECIEKITNDRFAHSANLMRSFSSPDSSSASPPPSQPPSGNSKSDGTSSSSSDSMAYQNFLYNQSMLFYNSVGGNDGNRLGLLNNNSSLRKDCWESYRLFCPDYIWADEAYQVLTKSLKLISKHKFYSTASSSAVVNPLSAGTSSQQNQSHQASSSYNNNQNSHISNGSGSHLVSMKETATDSSLNNNSSSVSQEHSSTSQYSSPLKNKSKSFFGYMSSNETESDKRLNDVRNARLKMNQITKSMHSRKIMTTNLSQMPQKLSSNHFVFLPNSKTQVLAEHLLSLIRIDIPQKLNQFKLAVEAESMVLKRMYLVKGEYRAPFRCFLESLYLQKIHRVGPCLNLVKEYLSIDSKEDHESRTSSSHHDAEEHKLEDDNTRLDKKGREEKYLKQMEEKRKAAQAKLSELLKDPFLIKSLKAEQHLDMLEMGMASILHPFAELARWLDSKKGRIIFQYIPNKNNSYNNYNSPIKAQKEEEYPLEEPDYITSITALRELTRRLVGSSSLGHQGPDHHYSSTNISSTTGDGTHSNNSESASGIRPLLVDLLYNKDEKMSHQRQQVLSGGGVGMSDREYTCIDPFDPIHNISLGFNGSEEKESEEEDNSTIPPNVLDRLRCFVSQIKTLSLIVKNANNAACKGWPCPYAVDNGIYSIMFLERKSHEIPFPIVRGCENVDTELLVAQFHDWYECVQFQTYHGSQQQQINQKRGSTSNSKNALSNYDRHMKMINDMRNTEMEISIAMTPRTSLQKVKQRLENHQYDCDLKFKALHEILMSVCMREMDLYVDVQKPCTWSTPSSSLSSSSHGEQQQLLHKKEQGPFAIIKNIMGFTKEEEEEEEKSDLSSSDPKNKNSNNSCMIDTDASILELPKSDTALGIFGDLLMDLNEPLPLG